MTSPKPAVRVAFGRVIHDDVPPKEPDVTALPWEEPEISFDHIGRGDTPYRLQRNEDLYTAVNIKRRQNLKKHPDVKKQINRVWMLLKKDSHGRLAKDEYVSLFVRLCKILNPDFNLADAVKVVHHDFERDSMGAPALTYELFFTSLFELADIWCPNIDGEEYANFLEKSFRRMTVKIMKLPDGQMVKVQPGDRVSKTLPRKKRRSHSTMVTSTSRRSKRGSHSRQQLSHSRDRKERGERGSIGPRSVLRPSIIRASSGLHLKGQEEKEQEHEQRESGEGGKVPHSQRSKLRSSEYEDAEAEDEMSDVDENTHYELALIENIELWENVERQTVLTTKHHAPIPPVPVAEAEKTDTGSEKSTGRAQGKHSKQLTGASDASARSSRKPRPPSSAKPHHRAGRRSAHTASRQHRSRHRTHGLGSRHKSHDLQSTGVNDLLAAVQQEKKEQKIE